MIDKIRLYVMPEEFGPIIDEFDHEVQIRNKAAFGHELFSFGGPVEYRVSDLLEGKKHWLCVDMCGRNFGVEPNGVYVRMEDVRRIINQGMQ